MGIRYKSQDFIPFSTGSWYPSFVLLMALFLLDYYYYSEYLTHLCSQGDPIQPLASCEAPAGYSFLFSRPLFPLCWPQLQFQIASSCQIFFPFFFPLFSPFLLSSIFLQQTNDRHWGAQRGIQRSHTKHKRRKTKHFFF